MNWTFERWSWLLPSGVLFLATLGAPGCSGGGPSSNVSTAGSIETNSGSKSPASSAAVDVDAIRPAVTAFCGDCHPLPPPSSFVRADWRREVERAYDIYHRTGRQDLIEPDLDQVVAFYEAQAPEKLEFPAPLNAAHSLPFQFRTQPGVMPSGKKEAGVSALLWHVPPGQSRGKLLLGDMRQGLVGEVNLEFEPEFREMALLKHVALLEPADLDADGTDDYLVAELGSYLPQDFDLGKVVWLRQSAGNWETHELAAGLGRVAQAVAGDFDGDGAVDVLVAEFGWITTGKIRLLKRTGDEDGIPLFEPSVVDSRHGASHLRKIDWDADGDLDFVALISQEHEKVELFLNDGTGTFTIETIFAASDPNFGSSGIELVDLDSDGDLDVLHTNGDAVDSFLVKPFHAVRWLENDGGFPFRQHVLTAMPGAYQAVAADFDLDGDQDVVAIAFPPEAVRMQPIQLPPYDLLVFLEQTDRGQFARHPVKVPMGGMALTAGDFDGDGDSDLATSNFGFSPAGVWLTIWWNKAKR